ncbi:MULTISPECIES: MTH938/NDUFAF3 family protein [unclassified Sphingomonas]|uniref:MTH938/NDUFAF3 family protein n=1 Tax=unclassified Sphingomonas TaxID=196159 RepID=UPI0021509CAA|nr:MULTISPECIES: MTH938/NDUFAF3 family protein [unclassified Sphingomonas]MCR5872581.1 MTH938/NDUFAF3 family protein [Sphingomonas sp. J344]UUX99132.1 MTH938/NDUFAF3 family protein [Sphingomonas sp. J315]
MRVDRTRIEGPVVSGFSGRGFRVDDGVYEGLILTPSRADGWNPPPIDALTVDDFAPFLAMDRLPEFVLLGTGSTLRRPSPALEAALPFGIDVMDSRAAARAWGVLRAELRWIGAALYPLD